MSKGKPRHNSAKPQNLAGGDYDCKYYDTLCGEGEFEFCHNHFNRWWQTKDHKLVCKGNPHNCKKQQLKMLASLPEGKRQKFIEQFIE